MEVLSKKGKKRDMNNSVMIVGGMGCGSERGNRGINGDGKIIKNNKISKFDSNSS